MRSSSPISLGSVIAYNLLKMEGGERRWRVVRFVTLGSPLAITAIRNSLGAREFPSCVREWFNAIDERDTVAVYPLDKRNFNVEPGVIANKSDVDNPTENHHGASGGAYPLGPPMSARPIVDPNLGSLGDGGFLFLASSPSTWPNLRESEGEGLASSACARRRR
jgi:hypothetical protein